jgi:ribosomal protein S18 acetylase RimI-like enzyme
MLLDEAERRFPKARYIFLCVSSFNPRARTLYERHGYRLIGELLDYVIDGASELLLAKRLG